MQFRDYQKLSGKTDLGTSAQDNLVPGWMSYVLGIGGETGELLEKVKKLFRDDKGHLTPERREAIILEMGDILWYMARLCSHLNIDFDKVPEMNLDKLASRQQRKRLKGDGDNR